MIQTVTLSLRGEQSYPGQDPDIIELVTEGTLENLDDGWKLCYEESELTGLAGVCTTFQIQDKTVTLIRTGKLNSQMVFEEGVPHDTLYEMEFGALMISVTARQVFFDIMPEGGSIDLAYEIEIEHSAAGTVDYHLDIRAVE